MKVAISFGLIAYVIHKTGLDTTEGLGRFKETLKNVNPIYFALSLIISVMLNVTSSWRWQILLKSKQIAVGLWRLLGFYYIGRFFNMFMPTSMGGDVARIWDLGRHTGENYEAFASVFMERFIGMVVLAAVSGIVLIAHPDPIPLITNSLLFVIGLVLFLLWLVLDVRVFNFVSNLLSPIHSSIGNIFSKLSLVHQAVFEYKNDKKTLFFVVSISSLFYMLAVINVWVSAQAFDSGVRFTDMLLAVPAIMLIMNLPVSIGGLGVMEAAYTTIFILFGYSPELALATALLMRFKTIVNAIIGGLVHLARLRATPETASHSKD